MQIKSRIAVIAGLSALVVAVAAFAVSKPAPDTAQIRIGRMWHRHSCLCFGKVQC